MIVPTSDDLKKIMDAVSVTDIMVKEDIEYDVDLDTLETSNEETDDVLVKTLTRKKRNFQPIILTMLFFLLNWNLLLFAQFSSSITTGLTYTDNAFQLSAFDLQRNEEGHPDLDFVTYADDVILSMKYKGSYHTQWRWWQIEPSIELNGNQNILNTSKQKADVLAGIKVSRRLGELGVFYGYYPDVYIRSYIDTDGTGESERFSYDRNHYRVDLRLKPVRTSTIFMQYRLDEYFYNKYFTEFDGNIDTWILGFQQNFPTFYLDASYSFRDYETKHDSEIDNPEDAAYESNIYSFGVLLKKMELDERYPSIQWRPELDLRFEQRFYQGGDNFHRNRTDNINTTTGRLHFFYGDRWNLILDYSHIFRNVDAAYSSVRKYKEYSENLFGVNAGYRF